MHSNEIRITLDNRSLRRFGARCVELILYRTGWGIDKDGKPFKEYSTRPFKMPAGAIPRRARKVLLKNGQLRYFKQNKALWVVVVGGYITLKKQIFSKTTYAGTPNLMLSGRMLGSLSVIRAADNTARIGFNRSEESQKAFWNKERGRDLLGLTDDDLEDNKLKEILSEGVLLK